jgi:hypothetical protein
MRSGSTEQLGCTFIWEWECWFSVLRKRLFDIGEKVSFFFGYTN